MTSGTGLNKYDFIGVGHSHLYSLINAQKKYHEHRDIIKFLLLNHYEIVFQKQGDKNTLNPTIHEKITHYIKEANNPLLITTIGGNSHNALGLWQLPQPIDFLVPGLDLPLDRLKSQFISYQQILDIFEVKLSNLFIIFDLVRENFDLPICHLESPPPIACNKHILKHLDPYFSSLVKHRKLSSKTLRLKLWKAHSDVYKHYCQKHSIRFISAPISTMDSEGFLLPRCYFEDATHGNAWYGKQVIEDLIKNFN